MIRAEVHNSGTMTNRLSMARARMGRRVQKGLMAVGQVLLEESNKLVPRDTESLVDSSRVRQIGVGLDSVVIVGYGRRDFYVLGVHSRSESRIVDRYPYEYAVYVHEDKEQRYPSGQTDYLREPTLTKRGEMRTALRQGIRK